MGKHANTYISPQPHQCAPLRQRLNDRSPRRPHVVITLMDWMSSRLLRRSLIGPDVTFRWLPSRFLETVSSSEPSDFQEISGKLFSLQRSRLAARSAHRRRRRRSAAAPPPHFSVQPTMRSLYRSIRAARITSASVLICWSPNMSFRSEKTRSQDAELGEMAKTMRAASAHAGHSARGLGRARCAGGDRERRQQGCGRPCEGSVSKEISGTVFRPDPSDFQKNF